MNFVLEMDFDSFLPEFQYFDIYPHRFWLPVTAPTSRPGQSCVSLQMIAVILSLQITD